VSSTRLATWLAVLFTMSVTGLVARQATPARDGAAIFHDECSGCHTGDDARAPSPEALRARAPRAIVDALSSGSMRYQGLSLNGAERRSVAEYLTGRKLRGAVTGALVGRCLTPKPFALGPSNVGWNGWGADIRNSHFQPAAGLSAAQVPTLQLKWAFGFPDASAAWAQPAIAGGRLFVGSQNGTVYSLDAKSGCIAWTFAAHAGVRASITIGRVRGATSAAYVADQQGYVYALNAATGRVLWERKVDDHPLVRLTGSPVLHDGRLYVPTSSYEEGGRPPGYACCTFRGTVVALDAKNGDEIWKAYTIPDRPTLQRSYADGSEVWGPSGGGIWSSPTIDAKRGAIYVAAGNSYSGPPQATTDAVVAFDLKSGAMRWAHQLTPNDLFGCVTGEINCAARQGPDFDFGASPVLARAGDRDLIVIGQKSGMAYALDPEKKGEQVWRYRASNGSGLGGIQWGTAADESLAYFPVSDIYSPMPGGLHAVDLATGERAWLTPPPAPVCGRPSRACSGAQFAAVTVIPGIVFSPSNDGAVRAFSTKDGAIVWTFDSNREFKTVNGVKAKGGSMNGPAPVVADGMVYVSSGYGTFGLRPGNVLLAFGL
jgi:polyvinyl alcohol dehydrogenase (cytochrome)